MSQNLSTSLFKVLSFWILNCPLSQKCTEHLFSNVCVTVSYCKTSTNSSKTT